MSGNIPSKELPKTPIVPAVAHEIVSDIYGALNAQLTVSRSDMVGDIGAYVFRTQGGQWFFMLPLKSATAMPDINSATQGAMFDVEQTLTVSNPPTQAQVNAIVSYTRSGFRLLKMLTDILKKNNFPS